MIQELYDDNGIQIDYHNYSLGQCYRMATANIGAHWYLSDNRLIYSWKGDRDFAAHFTLPVDLSLFCEVEMDSHNSRRVKRIISADAQRFESFIKRLMELRAFL